MSLGGHQKFEVLKVATERRWSCIRLFDYEEPPSPYPSTTSLIVAKKSKMK